MIKIICLYIYLFYKCFPLLLHSFIIGKGEHIFELLFCKSMLTICESLFQCLD